MDVTKSVFPVSIGIPGVPVTQGALPFVSATSRMAPRPFGESRLTVGTPMTMLHAGQCSGIRGAPTRGLRRIPGW
ncbi:MAG: hypothetical protein H6Q86_431 [candidate division NC10 bacterium]|jgi:hypothetical protein|nr:hypothetical protein [candidate division NC10 bacterium]